MSNSNLASLPPSMLHKILSKVATSHLRDFGCARIAFSGFNQIGREEYFYLSADLFNLNDWIDEANALRTFRLRCYQAGNLEAIYIRGIREFVDRMNYMITISVSSGHWGYEKPEVFMSLLERINPNVSHDYWCSAVIEPVFVVSLDGSRT
ncbi:unnamed protein product [Brassica rapa]|uniref:F-box domain-containing protein n=1 Tax=Brassica campestris TaxID=3711 RepID=A0A8D9MDC7_BRACM|nr:unnamed protein product [Brassica rapa]